MGFNALPILNNNHNEVAWSWLQNHEVDEISLCIFNMLIYHLHCNIWKVALKNRIILCKSTSGFFLDSLHLAIHEFFSGNEYLKLKVMLLYIFSHNKQISEWQIINWGRVSQAGPGIKPLNSWTLAITV